MRRGAGRATARGGGARGRGQARGQARGRILWHPLLPGLASRLFTRSPSTSDEERTPTRLQTTSERSFSSSDSDDGSEEREASGGHDESFVENLDYELECSICLLAMRDPVLTNCGHKFCKSCLLRITKDGTVRCCQCRRELDASSQIFPANDCKRKILSLKVKCRQSEDGCDWMGALRSVETHQMRCRAVKVACENECGESVMRWLMDDHLEQSCSKRLVDCVYCEEEMPADEIAEHQRSDKCLEKPVACTYCHKTMERRVIEKHVSQTDGNCPNAPIKCCYAETGCKYVCARKLMNRHLRSRVVYHSQLLVQEVKTLSKFKLSMETYVGARERPGTIIWAFRLPCEGEGEIPFAEESPVYTCDGGYRMSFTVSRSSNPILSLFASMSSQESEGPVQHSFPAEFDCVITAVNPKDSDNFCRYYGYLIVNSNEEKGVKITVLPPLPHKDGTALLKILLTHND